MSEMLEEERGEGSISMKLYYKFFRAGGSVLLLLATIAIFVFGEVGDPSVIIDDIYTCPLLHRLEWLCLIGGSLTGKCGMIVF